MMKYFLLAATLLIISCKQQNSSNILEAEIEGIKLFAEGLVTTGLYERDMAIDAEGTEIMYSLGDYKQSMRCLVSIKKSGNTWQDPQILHFSGSYNDIEPFFSLSGDRLYFASDRPLDNTDETRDYNLWYCKKTESAWSEPMAMDSIINTDADEYYPSLSKNGNLYFTSSRDNGIGSEDIFLSEYIDGQFTNPEVLDTNINTLTYEFNAYINPDETLLIFGSFGRKDGLGGGDLYISKKDETGQWGKAKNMGKGINSDKLDYCPFIDYPRNMFYFSSDRADGKEPDIRTINELKTFAERSLNGMGNIYRMPLDQALNVRMDSIQ